MRIVILCLWIFGNNSTLTAVAHFLNLRANCSRSLKLYRIDYHVIQENELLAGSRCRLLYFNQTFNRHHIFN